MAQANSNLIRIGSAMTQKKISIIYTGGTLGMRPSDKGYVPTSDLAGLIAERLPELAAPSMPSFEIREAEHPLDSANANPRFWYDLAERVRREGQSADGVIIIHGTDTLAYTASALSFLLGGFDKPVILTGSQIPLCEVRSDAPLNLISASQAIAADRLNEVCVCFGRHIFRGNRITKVKSTGLDAFASLNMQPLVEIGTDLNFASIGDSPSNGDVLGHRTPDFRDSKIAILRVFPGMPAGFIDAVVQSGADGMILSCYGVGTAPTADRDFLAALRRASEAGLLIIAVTQCHQGSVALNTYAAGSALADAGAVSGYDMTTEAAFTKLHALLSLAVPREEIARLIQQNLRGELTPH